MIVVDANTIVYLFVEAEFTVYAVKVHHKNPYWVVTHCGGQNLEM